MEENEEVRSWFSTVVAQTVPTVGFTGDDVVVGGRARVRRQRFAVLGGMASVAALGIAAAVVSGGSGSSARPAAPPDDRARALADAAVAAESFKILLKDLDPAGTHLRIEESTAPDALLDHGGVCSSYNGKKEAYVITGTWTSDGKPPANDKAPRVSVAVELFSPSHTDEVDVNRAGIYAPGTRTFLSDGSRVTVAESTTDISSVEASRKLPEHRGVFLWVIDGTGEQGTPSSDPTVPFPFTKAQLTQVVTDMAVKFPFADGYQPECRY